MLSFAACVPQKKEGNNGTSAISTPKEKVSEDNAIDLTEYKMVRQKTKSGKNIIVLIEK